MIRSRLDLKKQSVNGSRSYDLKGGIHHCPDQIADRVWICSNDFAGFDEIGHRQRGACRRGWLRSRRARTQGPGGLGTDTPELALATHQIHRDNGAPDCEYRDGCVEPHFARMPLRSSGNGNEVRISNPLCPASHQVCSSRYASSSSRRLPTNFFKSARSHGSLMRPESGLRANVRYPLCR
jgi:hypothetical protein